MDCEKRGGIDSSPTSKGHETRPSMEREQTPSSINIPAENKPFNEFEANDTLLYATFPFLYLFGRGLASKGSVPRNAIRNMMLQFHARFPTYSRLIFCLFDQMQRHAAS